MTDTPVPADYRVTWSHSSLSSFQICPHKFYHEKVAQTYPDKGNAAAAWGNEVHLALENYGKHFTPLPSNMVQFDKTTKNIDALRKVTSRLEFEYKFAVNKAHEPVAWDDPDYYGRCIADVFGVDSLDPTRCIIVDYKTGKYRGPTLQPVINAKLVFDTMPEIQTVKTAFAYITAGKTELGEFHRSAIRGDFNPVATLVEALETATANQNFPMKRGFLCKNYCSVMSCPHNGRGR